MVPVESVSAPHDMIKGAISGVQSSKNMETLCLSCSKIVAFVCLLAG